MSRLIAIGGLSGSGKTTLAAALARELNAVHFDSDRTRKELFGVAPETRLPPEAYTPEATRRLIGEMARRVRAALAEGKTVIVSALFNTEESRAEEAALAADFTGIWLEVDLETLLARVRARANDASDAGEEIVRRQKATGEMGWHVIDAGLAAEEVLRAAKAALG